MPKQRKDLTGIEINKLTFLSYSHTKKETYWNIKCHCGNIFTCIPYDIKTGNTKSCGCLRTKHNLSATPEYSIWFTMKTRCYNTNCLKYKNYGGRGIKICNEWLNDFTIFLKDMGYRPSPNHSIERKDNNGNYCKDNCIWEISKKQARNKRNNILLTYNNETKTMMEWSEIVHINYNTLKRRKTSGWSDIQILTTPVRKWPSQL